MGHLEACAAGAGLASLLSVLLVVDLIAINAQLSRHCILLCWIEDSFLAIQIIFGLCIG